MNRDKGGRESETPRKMKSGVLGEINTSTGTVVLCPASQELVVLPSSGQHWYRHTHREAKNMTCSS